MFFVCSKTFFISGILLFYYKSPNIKKKFESVLVYLKTNAQSLHINIKILKISKTTQLFQISEKKKSKTSIDIKMSIDHTILENKAVFKTKRKKLD